MTAGVNGRPPCAASSTRGAAPAALLPSGNGGMGGRDSSAPQRAHFHGGGAVAGEPAGEATAVVDPACSHTRHRGCLCAGEGHAGDPPAGGLPRGRLPTPGAPLGGGASGPGAPVDVPSRGVAGVARSAPRVDDLVSADAALGLAVAPRGRPRLEPRPLVRVTSTSAPVPPASASAALGAPLPPASRDGSGPSPGFCDAGSGADEANGKSTPPSSTFGEGSPPALASASPLELSGPAAPRAASASLGSAARAYGTRASPDGSSAARAEQRA